MTESLAGRLSSVDRAMQVYGDQIGRKRAEVTTPALLLDLDVVRRNCAAMSERFAKLPASLRPHNKVHKCPTLSRMEVAAGAVGVACATVWEAEAMAAAGVEDILIANQVVHPDKVRLLASVAKEHRITVAVDDVRNVAALDAAAGAAGARIELLIEIDVGMGRAGVRSVEDALPVAEAIGRASHLELRGLQGYEGHCMIEKDRDAREEKARIANAKLIEAADYLASRGHKCRVLSAGGTGTYSITGSNPRINEVQAGSYLLMDVFHEGLIPGEFEPALTVLGTVVSQRGGTAVLDAGRKSVSADYLMPRPLHDVAGVVRSVNEEHCVIDFEGRPTLVVGDTVELVPSYAPTNVNLHDAFHVVESGTVTDIWPIEARPRFLGTLDG
jgi:D-serine deaminase-like pyridoxal phosphate-dependent protein